MRTPVETMRAHHDDRLPAATFAKAINAPREDNLLMLHRTCMATLAICLLIAGCGGGTPESAQHEAPATSAEQRLLSAATAEAARDEDRRRALAAGSYSAELAGKLFTLAESSYAAYFPSKQSTRGFEGWSYRYYSETDVYLAVIGDAVFVMGGSFGPEVIALGPITKFVTASGSGRDRPLTAGILNQCPDVTASSSAGFHTCMVGHLTGTQTFDKAKPCRLDFSEDGVLTLSSDGRSGSIGPAFASINFTKSASFGNFYLFLASNVGSPAARMQVLASPTISFVEGGALKVEYTAAGTTTASISCTLDVPR